MQHWAEMGQLKSCSVLNTVRKDESHAVKEGIKNRNIKVKKLLQKKGFPLPWWVST